MNIQTLLVYFPMEPDIQKQITAALPETEVVFCDGNPTVLKQTIGRADVIFGNVPFDLLPEAVNLKWLHLASAGTDGFKKLMTQGVLLSNGSGAYNDTIAEFMLGLTSALCLGLPRYGKNQREHVWQWSGWTRYIMDSTIAILGCGQIGCGYARRVKALGAHTLGVRRSAGPAPEGVDEIFTTDQLSEVLPRADIVAMVMPNTPETKGIMNAARFAEMKDGAMLINVGRGNAVVPEDLYDALTGGKLSGAAIDVAYQEPLPADSKLWDAPNLIITPHVAGGWNLQSLTAPPAMQQRITNVFLDNLSDYLADRPLRNTVDQATGYTKTKH